MRADLQIIQDWIAPGSRVLDLGCGDGELLAQLRERDVTGYGLEIDPEKIAKCIERGVNVIEQNLDQHGLGNFSDNSFDVVVMTQSLQALRYPDKALAEMLRVGRTCIITFPNFGHWRCRWYLSSKGRMPVSDFLPYTWYNTPNIHFCTFEDFERLCYAQGAKIEERLAVDRRHRNSLASRLWPNLMGEIGIYRISGTTLTDHAVAV